MPNRNRNTQPQPISHRTGTKAARAHLFVRAMREQEASIVIPEMIRKFELTPSTARNWYQSFKSRPMDLTPISPNRGSKRRTRGRTTDASARGGRAH